MQPFSQSEAAEYVAALTGHPDTPVTLQAFDDDADRKRRDLAQIRGGSIAKLWPWVCDLQEQGSGMFCTVNNTTLGRREAVDVTAVRAVFIDCDHRTEVGREFHLPPSLIVSSGRGLHVYWMLDPWPAPDGREFKTAQHRLRLHYKTDPAPCDLPRVMRLPGTWHQKASPVPVRIVLSSGLTYTPDEVMCGVDSLPQPPRPVRREIAVIGGAVDTRTVDVESLVSRAGLNPQPIGNNRWAIECPWRSQHTGGLQGPTAAVVFGGDGQHPGFKCFHGSCESRTIFDLLGAVGVDVIKNHAQTRPTYRATKATARAAARLEALR